MIKIHFVSLSLGASVDQQTGNLSIFDLLEEIRTPQVPLHLQTLVLSVSLEKLSEDAFSGKMLIQLLPPNGLEQSIGSGSIKFLAQQKRMKAVFRFGAFPVNAFGKHQFILSCIHQNEKKIAESSVDFEVVQFTHIAQGIEVPEKIMIQH